MFNWLRRLWPAKSTEEVVQVEEETIVVAELPDGETMVMDIDEVETVKVKRPSRRTQFWSVLAAVLAVGLLLWLFLMAWCSQPMPTTPVSEPTPVTSAPPPPPVEPPPPPVVTPIAAPPPPPVVKPAPKPHRVVKVASHHRSHHNC